MPVEQPQAAKAAVVRALADYEAFALTALHVMTTLTGSALLALAHARGRLGIEEAWAAAHVDEDWQSRPLGRGRGSRGPPSAPLGRDAVRRPAAGPARQCVSRRDRDVSANCRS